MDTTQNTAVSVDVNIATLLGVVLFFIVMLLGIARVDTFLKNQAITECAQISRTENTSNDGKTKYVYPLVDVYKDCLAKKGIK